MRSIYYGNNNLLAPNGPRQLASANLYEITLMSGTVLRYTSWEHDLVFDGHVWSHGAPYLTSSSVKISVGVQVDTLKLTINSGLASLISGIPVIAAIRGGMLAGAGFRQFKVLMQTAGVITPLGAVAFIWFTGNIGPVDSVSGATATITVRSALAILDTQVPRRTLQPSCPFVLFDAGCGLARAAFKTSDVVQLGSTRNKILTTSVRPDGYYNLGVAEFTSGANAGVRRPVRGFIAGELLLAVTLPNPPNAGDTFDMYPGCDKKQSTCDVKFSNLVHFGGTPYVPVPETAL